jgi:hypothetical protein
MKKLINRFACWLQKLTEVKYRPAWNLSDFRSDRWIDDFNRQMWAAAELNDQRLNDINRRVKAIEARPVAARSEPRATSLSWPAFRQACSWQAPDDLVTCKTCGCAVKTHAAIKGKPEIRETPEEHKTFHWMKWNCSDPEQIIKYEPLPDHFLYYPHYCKACAPKGSPAKK